MSICHELRRRGDDKMIAYLHERPAYCDRGRWRQGIEVNIFRSDADPAPRYYFDLQVGKSETEAYLLAKKIDLTDTVWVERHYE